MIISGIFAAVSNMITGYERQMNFFYSEVAKMDTKTQMSVLGSMHIRR